MIEAPVGIRVVRGKTRCHPYLTDIAVFYAITLEAVSQRFGLASSPESHMVLACRAADADVAIPLKSYAEAAVTGVAPDEILVGIHEKLSEPEGVNAAGMESISTRIVAAIFSVFVERGGDWLKRSGRTGFENWPPVANFCRVVRNAIVHGGTINIASETAIGVQWRHLKYDHLSNGRAILNEGDLSIGDLVVLILELEMELNDLGAPFDLG